ncbi:MAG: potassium-transporting ATPase subunit C [Patulibacter sp.]
MRKDTVTALLAVVVFTAVLGILYPLAITGVSRLTMGDRAAGSLVEHDGRTVGSRLIGQDFRRPAVDAAGDPIEDAAGEPVLVADPRYFQSRPSVTGYAADATAFSNRGPNGVDTRDAIVAELAAYLKLERPFSPGLTARDVPVDAVTDSASGVDPQISVANARIQSRRVAASRRLPEARVRELVDTHTAVRALGVLGEPAVDVLALNLALDREPAPRAAAPSADRTTTDPEALR